MMNSRERRWPRGVLAGLCAVLLSAAVAACGDDDAPTSTGGSEGGAAESASIGYASPVASNPNQADVAYGMEQAAKSLGWELSVLDSNLSPDKQVANIDTFLSQQKDGIMTWALDPGAVGGSFERAAAEEIPVVGLNSAGDNVASNIVWAVYTCGPGSPGAETSAYIAERAPNAKVLVVGPPPVPALLEHTKCFEKEAEKAGLEVVARVDNVKDAADTATPLVAGMLTRHPDIDAIWNYNDTSALGAAAAVLGANKDVWTGEKKGLIIFGSNSDKEAIEAIKDGRITATWDTNAAATGWAAVRALKTHLADGEPVEAMPKEVVLESKLWDGENIADFVPQQQRKFTMDNLPIVSEK
jgi:ribose transport system substrate-binding protein